MNIEWTTLLDRNSGAAVSAFAHIGNLTAHVGWRDLSNNPLQSEMMPFVTVRDGRASTEAEIEQLKRSFSLPLYEKAVFVSANRPFDASITDDLLKAAAASLRVFFYIASTFVAGELMGEETDNDA